MPVGAVDLYELDLQATEHDPGADDSGRPELGVRAAGKPDGWREPCKDRCRQGLRVDNRWRLQTTVRNTTCGWCEVAEDRPKDDPGTDDGWRRGEPAAWFPAAGWREVLPYRRERDTGAYDWWWRPEGVVGCAVLFRGWC